MSEFWKTIIGMIGHPRPKLGLVLANKQLQSHWEFPKYVISVFLMGIR